MQALLRFWGVCERYYATIKAKLRRGAHHFTSFTLARVRELVAGVNTRLGYGNNTLSYRAVDLVWDMCRHASTLYTAQSPPWTSCAGLSCGATMTAAPHSPPPPTPGALPSLRRT